jgi:hypothetical protein
MRALAACDFFPTRSVQYSHKVRIEILRHSGNRQNQITPCFNADPVRPGNVGAIFSQKIWRQTVHEINELIESIRLDNQSGNITFGIEHRRFGIPASDDMKI